MWCAARPVRVRAHASQARAAQVGAHVFAPKSSSQWSFQNSPPGGNSRVGNKEAKERFQRLNRTKYAANKVTSNYFCRATSLPYDEPGKWTGPTVGGEMAGGGREWNETTAAAHRRTARCGGAARQAAHSSSASADGQTDGRNQPAEACLAACRALRTSPTQKRLQTKHNLSSPNISISSP